jgi:SAM-dependent methyltransferase
MSVDRLAGSGTAGGDTEPARRRRAQRRGTGRRRGGDASAAGLAEPGQAGQATAAPESNVILLGQEAGPGPSAATPERSAAAPAGQEQAEAAAHAGEAARTGAAPTNNAATAEAGAKGAAVPETAAAEAGAKGAAVSDPAATEADTTEADATQACTTEADATQAGTTEADATKAGTTEADATPADTTEAAATQADTTEAAVTEADATEAAAVPDRAPRPAPADTGLFARYTRDYVTGHDGHQITILQAGCTTADGDLGVSVLREAGADVAVSLIDDDQPVTRAALAADGSLAGCVQGDLRTVPLPPRSHDIVLCSLLLQRIDHAELVLDRLVAAIRPGGLLLLRFSDRDSSGGFLDRVMPLAARNAVWRKRRPGRPGPYPAVYERLSSVRGVQAYALMRELVIAERQALGGLAGALAEPRGFLAAQKLVAWLSRGRLTAAHEELLYVLRKPEDRFARIL